MSNETADAARRDALGYVEQTIYANEDSSATVTWRNDEVLSVLAEIAELLRVDDEECPACDAPLSECGGPDAACCADCGHRNCWPTNERVLPEIANGVES